jgi:hypothetical protein
MAAATQRRWLWRAEGAQQGQGRDRCQAAHGQAEEGVDGAEEGTRVVRQPHFCTLVVHCKLHLTPITPSRALLPCEKVRHGRSVKVDEPHRSGFMVGGRERGPSPGPPIGGGKLGPELMCGGGGLCASVSLRCPGQRRRRAHPPKPPGPPMGGGPPKEGGGPENGGGPPIPMPMPMPPMPGGLCDQSVGTTQRGSGRHARAKVGRGATAEASWSSACNVA